MIYVYIYIYIQYYTQIITLVGSQQEVPSLLFQAVDVFQQVVWFIQRQPHQINQLLDAWDLMATRR